MTGFGYGSGGYGEEYDPHEPHELDDIEPEESESMPEAVDLGYGVKLVISPDAFRTIMHTPEITAQVAERCQQIADAANTLKEVDKAEYTVFVSNNLNNIRARGRVKTGNSEAIHDNNAHSTLMKALAQYPSDPKPDGYTTNELPEGETSFYEETEGEPEIEAGGEEGIIE